MNLKDLENPEVVAARIAACREELAALKRLSRMMATASRAESARALREQQGAASLDKPSTRED